MTTATRSKQGRRAGDQARNEPESARREQHLDLEVLGACWWSAFDAAETALGSACAALSAQELRERRGCLSRERGSTVELLVAVARAERMPAHFSQLLASRAR
jgi:hypothetical protein